MFERLRERSHLSPRRLAHAPAHRRRSCAIRRRIFPAVIDELAERHGDKPALLSDRETFSYRALAERSRRYTRWALAQGLAKGDVVALLMPNRPEYLAIWLGLTRAGATVALLNTNLTGASLAFCIDIVAPRHVIVAAELVGRARFERELSQDRRRASGLHGEPARTPAAIPASTLAVAALDGGPLAGGRTPAAHHRGQGAVHLHLRHDGHAEGGQHQPLPADARGLRLRRRDGHAAGRPHV